MANVYDRADVAVLGTCVQVDRALDSRSEGLGFDSHETVQQCLPQKTQHIGVNMFISIAIRSGNTKIHHLLSPRNLLKHSCQMYMVMLS